jgi:small subunit ribosomal protein S15
MNEQYHKRGILNFSRQQLMSKFAQSEGDVGSPEVQVALLQLRIAEVSEHLKQNKKDFNSYKRLREFIGKYQGLLRYLHRKSAERYHALIGALGIKDRL